MRFLGYEDKIVRLLEALYEGTRSTVRVGGDLAECVLVGVGIMQGCLLSPLLFNILLEVVIALHTYPEYVSLIFILLTISA